MSKNATPEIVVKVLQNAIDSGREHLKTLNEVYAQAKEDMAFQKTGSEIFKQQGKLDLNDQMRGHINHVFGDCDNDHTEAAGRVREIMEKIEKVGSDLDQLVKYTEAIATPLNKAATDELLADETLQLPFTDSPVGPSLAANQAGPPLVPNPVGLSVVPNPVDPPSVPNVD